jgi:hypothetical protein
MRRPRRRRSLGPLGGRVSLRWEIGAPLIVLGIVVAGLMLGIRGGGAIFWSAVVVAGLGLAALLEGG